MTVETATYISDLNATLPAATDGKAEGDDHLRLIKSTIKNTFPNINGAATATDEQLSALPTVAQLAAMPSSSQLTALQTIPYVQGFRLTPSAGDGTVQTADVSTITAIYAQPFKGDQIGLYDGTRWNLRSSGAMTIAVPAVANQVYDVFCYDNAGTPTLELAAWASDTARTTALAFQNGVLVKSGFPTRRYLGSFRTTAAAGQTEDSVAKRYLWNYYHRVRKPMRALEAAASWSYASSTWRQANANTANQLDFLVGVSEDMVVAEVFVGAQGSATGTQAAAAIGLDSTTTPATGGIHAATDAGVNQPGLVAGSIKFYPGQGRHTLVWLEATVSSVIFWGTTGTVGTQSGIHGEILA